MTLNTQLKQVLLVILSDITTYYFLHSLFFFLELSHLHICLFVNIFIYCLIVKCLELFLTHSNDK